MSAPVRVIVVCGVGGAGKTTTAAGLALAWARAGRRVVVLTIDPARRLADALGVAHLGNTPTPVPAPGLPATASLDALMLDRKATWDELVRRQVSDPDRAARLLVNPYYRALSERLSGGHEYMATEKLYHLAMSGRWDVVVVDTPPSQHALDFFRAPDRIRRILDQRLLGSILRPSTGIAGIATRPVVDLVRRLAGDAVIDDLSEFFSLVGDAAAGLSERGAAVSKLLRSPSCGFVLTTSARAPQEAEISVFLPAIRELGLRAEGILVNRATLPLPVPTRQLEDSLPAAAPARDDLLALVHAHDARAAHDQALVERLARAWSIPVWRVPDLAGGVGDLAALGALAEHLPPGAEARA
jgi:anion-transporting  ArsA/GET3 family ATPase